LGQSTQHVRAPRLPFSRSENLEVPPPSSPCLLSWPQRPRASSLALPPLPSICCGRGDKKTAKGKRFKHSFGNARPRDKTKGRGPPRAAVPPSPPKKDRFDDGEIVKIEIDESLFS
ncbi:unnamed protein product, partial [Musa textilis]